MSRRFRIDERYRAYPIHLMHYSDRTLRGMSGRAGWTVEATFTLGIGLDDCFTCPATPCKPTAHVGESGGILPPPERRLRHTLRDGFRSLGIGENLAAIAYPNRS